jgi:transcriptional regulator with XRE-family HTH domain
MFLRHIVYSLRRRAGLTQAELASKARTTESTICHIEQGDRTPSTRLASRLATALEEPPETFARALMAEHWCGDVRCPQLTKRARSPLRTLSLLLAWLPWL